MISIASITRLAPKAGSPEQILCDTNDPSFYKTFQNHRKLAQGPAVTLETT